MSKLNLVCYIALLSIISYLSISTHRYKIQSIEKSNIINSLTLDLENTKLNLDEANKNIEIANQNLENYIQLNNNLNKQLKEITSIIVNPDNINEEVKQINCMFNNITKKGNCINGQFIED